MAVGEHGARNALLPAAAVWYLALSMWRLSQRMVALRAHMRTWMKTLRRATRCRAPLTVRATGRNGQLVTVHVAAENRYARSPSASVRSMVDPHVDRAILRSPERGSKAPLSDARAIRKTVRLIVKETGLRGATVRKVVGLERRKRLLLLVNQLRTVVQTVSLKRTQPCQFLATHSHALLTARVSGANGANAQSLAVLERKSLRSTSINRPCSAARTVKRHMVQLANHADVKWILALWTAKVAGQSGLPNALQHVEVVSTPARTSCQLPPKTVGCNAVSMLVRRGRQTITSGLGITLSTMV